MRFNYESFRMALKKVEEERFLILQKDIKQVKAWVEKALTMCLDSTANMSRATYSGVDM
jgi:hypothetical protein